jgi:hypothetical protein
MRSRREVITGLTAASASVVLSACCHSTECFDVPDSEAVATAYRQMDYLLKHTSPAVGIPANLSQSR